MATPLEDELTAIIGSEAPQGVRRRADVSYTSEKPDYAKEADAAITRVGSYAPAVTGLARQIGGDQEGAMADYRRSAAIEAEADSRDSNQSTDWRDIDGVGSALGFARKLATQSAPDAILSLGAGGLARGLARRTAMDVERRAIASRVASDLATPGVSTPLTRQVAAQQATARAATAGVAAQQRREAVDQVAGEALERMPAAQRRIDRAGRAGAFVGAAAGQFPGMVAGSREQLEQTDQEGAAKIALGDAAAAALGAIPAERVLGRLANNPAARQATQEGAIGLLQRAGRVGKEAGTQAALEGTTEAAQAAVQRAGHAWVNDNISLVSREALDEYVANFIGGAAIGGSLAGSIETGQQGAGALRDAGRWAWDAAGTARKAIRERLGAQADRLRAKMATDEDEATAKPSRKGSKQGPKRTSGDMFGDARRTLDGLANRGMDAASAFLDRFAGVKNDDDLDARADAVMDRMQAITQRADGAPIGDGVVAKAPSFTQKWLLSQVNPDFLARVPEEDALRLGRILDKYANGRELAGVEARTLNRVISSPESGLTQDVLDTFVGIGPLVRDLDKKLSATADADAPRLAQPRREELAEVTEADQANAEAEALASGEDASGLDIRDLNSGNSERGPERLSAIDRMESARRTINSLNNPRWTDSLTPEERDTRLSAARAEGRAARDEARSEILGELKIRAKNNKVFPRNAAHPEPYNKRRQDPDTVELVEPQPFQLDNKVDMRPILLDLGSLIQRQQTLMRNEGTTETDIAPEQALLRGLAEAQMAGLEVNPDTLSLGDINVKGRFVMKMTPRLRRYLKAELPKSAKAFDPDTLQPVRDEDALLDEFARSERPDDLIGENVIDSGVPEDNRALVPRERPPGVRDNGTEQGTRRKEPDNPNEYPDVEAVASLAERAVNAGVNAAAAEAIDAFMTGASTVQQMADGINASGTRQTPELFELLGLANMGRGVGYAPRPRNEPGNRTGDFIPSESIVSNVNADAPYAQILNEARKQRAKTDDPKQHAKIVYEAGVKIGTAEIKKEYDAGLMSDERFESEMAELLGNETRTSSESLGISNTKGRRDRVVTNSYNLAKKYVLRASRGDFDTARVTHRKADNEARKGRDDKDRAADPDNVKAANKVDRVSRRVNKNSLAKRGKSTSPPDVPSTRDAEGSTTKVSRESMEALNKAARDNRDGTKEVRNAKGGLVAEVSNRSDDPFDPFDPFDDDYYNATAIPGQDEFIEAMMGMDVPPMTPEDVPGYMVAEYAMAVSLIINDKATDSSTRHYAQAYFNRLIVSMTNAEMAAARDMVAERNRADIRAANKAGMTLEAYRAKVRTETNAANKQRALDVLDEMQAARDAAKAADRRSAIIEANRKGTSVHDVLYKRRLTQMQHLMEVESDFDVDNDAQFDRDMELYDQHGDNITFNEDGTHDIAKRSDSDAPADGKATPNPKITPYQRDAEGKWVNDLLKLLGLDKLLTLTVGVRTDRGHSGRIFPRRGAVELSDNLTGVERQEVLLHELGHGIVYAEVAKQLGVTVDEVVTMFQGDHAAMIEKANPELFAALMEDFNAWRLGITSGTKVLDARAGRSPKQRLENMRERLGARADLTVGELKAEAAEYELSFDEWLADNISRALLARKDVTDSMTRVEKLFASVAKKIREIYDSLTNAGYKPAPSVEQWVASMFDPNVSAVRQATGTTVTPGVAHAVVEAAVTNAAELFNRLPRAAGATTGVGKAVDPKAAPFPGANRIGKAKRAKPARSFASMVEYARNVLRPKERQLLYDLFNTPVVHQRLMKVYAKQPEILAAMEDAQTGMEARIAAGYLAWQNKQFNVGPKGRSLLNGIGDDLLLLFKVAGKGLIAERLLNDIARGHVRAMRQAGREYDVHKLATRHGGTLQQVINKVGDLREKIWAPVSRALESNSRRMFESGVPAMRQIAGLLYKPTGTTGTDRGMVREVVHRTAQFAERAAGIMDGLSAGQQRRVLQLLQEQADEKRLSAKITNKRHKNFGKHRYSPKVRRAVAGVRELMNESFAYMEQAGVRVGYRKNFFPVMLDLRNERAKERLTTLLMDPKFEEDIRAFFDADPEPDLYAEADDAGVPIEALVKRLVDGATGTGAPAKTNAGAPNFRGANYRVMEFIYRIGDKAQIKEFADLQTKNPAEAFARYIEPMVRRAEYARRFKDDGTGLDKLLNDMSRQGADDNQIREAREAVEAALGTYGSDLSPTLEAISPALAKRFSGPKTRATTQGLQAYQNARLLPLALISSFVDPMGIAVRTGGDFATSWKGFKAGMRGLVNKDQRAQLQDMMKLLGASSDMATMEALQQGFGGAGNTTAARVNDFIFRWNGMAAWTRATRYMALTSAHHFLLKHGSSTDATSQRYLRELGLQPGDIKADPSATTADGAPRQQVLLMDAAMLKRATPAQREADARVKSALMQFVDDAVLRPNSQQVPQWHSDPFMGLVTQYKAFSYAIYDQIVGRIDTELKNGNSKVLLAAASYMPIIIAAEILRDVAQGDGEDKEEWGPDDYLLLGVDKSGLYSPVFGAFGDAVEDVRNDRLPGSSNIGPTASQARNVTQALSGSRDLGKEFESALPGSAWYRKWNDESVAEAQPG